MNNLAGNFSRGNDVATFIILMWSLQEIRSEMELRQILFGSSRAEKVQLETFES